MTVHFDRAPDAARAPLADCARLADAQGDHELARLAREAARNQPDGDGAHQVFRLTLEDAAVGSALSHARPVSWRFLLGEGERAVSVEVQCDQMGYTHDFTDISDGPLTQGTLTAVEQARNDGAFAEGDYTVALVRLPALHVQALWLRTDGCGRDDRWIPIPPSHPDLEPGRVYTEAELHRRLQEAAGDTRVGLDPLDELIDG